ncbi:hypothetical protein FO519_009217 [Halicephalobus sp. NKZ332]|nr:hypothetical protein FO519_009217 [Halicephalobus sp. NKZ332]
MIRREMRAAKNSVQHEICQICEDKAHGFHFGVLSCRACSAFFRRTIALNMIYHCRFQRTCQIDKSIRCMCRRCRYEKCIALGMNPDSVQLHRDSIKSTKKSKSSIKSSKLPSLDLPPSNPKLLDDSEKELFSRINLILDEAIINPRTSEDVSLLEMFEMGLDHLRKRRSEVHFEKLADLELYHGTDDFLKTLKENWHNVVDMSGREVDLYAELLSFIRPFVLLPEDQRWPLFKQFALSFMRFERAYEVYRVLGDNLEDLRSVTFNGQVIDFYGSLLKEVHYSKEKEKCKNILSMFKFDKTQQQKGLVDPLKEIKITEVEFCALCLHLLWVPPGFDILTEKTEKTATYCRRRIFADLHNYYINSLGMTNYAVRLGDFLALMTTLEKNVSKNKEHILVADLFSLTKIHPNVYILSR